MGGRGVDLIFPADWHYAMRLLPHQLSQAEVDDIVAAVTPKMIEKSWIMGTPEEIAAQLQPWVDAGASYVAPSDLAPSILEPDEQPDALRRMVDVARLLKHASVPALSTTT